MIDLGTLREEVAQLCLLRKHSIQWMPPWHGESGSTQTGICLHCHREVSIGVLLHLPEPQVEGKAVTDDCEGLT